jgi:hypothetical protein
LPGQLINVCIILDPLIYTLIVYIIIV